MLAVVNVFALLVDAPLEAVADATRTPNPAKAPWYFLGLQELVHYGAIFGGVVVPTALVVALLVLPYVDTHPRGVGVWFARERRLANAVFAAVALALVAVTVDRHVLPRPELGLRAAVGPLKPDPGLGRGVSSGLRWAFALSSLALLATVVWAGVAEYRAEWRVLQRRFRASVPATAPAGADDAEARGLQQIWLPDIDRVDRCTTCHLGVDRSGA